jgi:REP element-mobilizing transposase RayT
VPRRARREYVFAGGTYHVWSRGSNRGAIFVQPRDRIDFVSWLGKAATGHEWGVLAYALMTNHYHLAVHIPDGGLSDGMKLLNGTFSRRQSAAARLARPAVINAVSPTRVRSESPRAPRRASAP